MTRWWMMVVLSALVLAACGDEGADPKNGVDGRDGLDGRDGSDGASSLVAIVPEPAGEHCEHGGQRIETGRDLDGDGVLSASEVSAVAYVCDAVSGGSGEPGLHSLIRLTRIHGEGACEHGGLRVEVGLDTDRSGELDDEEVDASQTQYLCDPDPGWAELGALPGVETVHGFALAANTTDGSARLGFMFLDPDYQAELEAMLWGSGIYSGPQTYVTYRLDGAASWLPYEGRRTPQFYQFSELVVFDDDSFYTTNFPQFGGLLSVIKNGKDGAYAPTSVFSDQRSHSPAYVDGDDTHLYFLMAQRDANVFGAGNFGLSFVRLPMGDSSFTVWPPRWELISILEPLEVTQDEVSEITMTNAGDVLVASYVRDATAVFLATRDLDGIEAAIDDDADFDFPEIASCTGAVLADAAWDGSLLYVACVDEDGALELRRASIEDLDVPLVWETVPTPIVDAIDALDLEASAARGVSIAVRQGGQVRVYTSLSAGTPSFDEAIAGEFDHVHTAEGIVLTADDDGVLRSFLR